MGSLAIKDISITISNPIWLVYVDDFGVKLVAFLADSSLKISTFKPPMVESMIKIE